MPNKQYVASAGYLPAPNFIADAFSQYTIDLQIPYYNFSTGKQEYSETNLAFLFDEGVNGVDGTTNTDLMFRLECIWQGVQAQWRAYNFRDESSGVTTPIYEGENSATETELSEVEIVIDTIGPAVNRWYMPSNFGKFGWFTWGYGYRFCPVTWINFKASRMLAPKIYLGWSLYLEPGCSGHITTYRREQPPQMLYTGKYTGAYPADEDYLKGQWY